MSVRRRKRQKVNPRLKTLFDDVYDGPEAITVTGKRVQIHSPDSWAHMKLNDAFKTQDPQAVLNAFSAIARKYVWFDLEGTGDYRQLTAEEYREQVLLAEEMDLLWLLRWGTSSSDIPYMDSCPCPQQNALTAVVPGKAFRRRLFENDDPNCPAKVINAAMDEAWDELSDKREWDNIAWMREEWSEIPHDHIDPTREIRVTFTEDDLDADDFVNMRLSVLSDLVVFAQLPLAGNRNATIEDAKTSDLQAGAVALSQMLSGFVTGFVWPSKGIDEREERKLAIKQFLQGAKGPILAHLERKIMVGAGGIENRARVDCSECGKRFSVPIPFDRGFILPSGS